MNTARANGSAQGGGGHTDSRKHTHAPMPLLDTKMAPAQETSVSKPADPPTVVDAGLRSLDHYRRALPKWRYDMRQAALPLIRWETPYLAWIQHKLRSPALDSYFAVTANLGTHTFFMIFLPIMFWCGFPSFGKGLVHILAAGVFWSGFVKDFFSLPRPLSPPLHRITMSGSVALEYGFPSTHSANAVSVAVYAILCLRSPDNAFAPSTKSALEALAYFYTVSIIFGRLYCGMHGFVDVVVGGIMGAAISLVEWYAAPFVDAALSDNGWSAVLLFVLAIIILIRIHPEPADDCPCFDDSVSFSGVVIGLECASWHYNNGPSQPAFDLAALGWPAAVCRIVLGILAILAWREVAKPCLLKGLPHVFRLIETWGLSLPRRFFKPASEYNSVPARLRVDNVMPEVSDLPGIITSIRHPGRGRSISIGPQSAADAYETLAYRERRRRESLSESAGADNPAPNVLRAKASAPNLPVGGAGNKTLNGAPKSASAAVSTGASIAGPTAQRRLAEYERQMGEGTVVVASPVDMAAPGGAGKASRGPQENGTTGSMPHGDGGRVEPDMDLFVGQQDELSEREVFSRLVKPRVRYDIEVVTKLVVYAGIAWIAVEGAPVLFESIPGLGMVSALR